MFNIVEESRNFHGNSQSHQVDVTKYALLKCQCKLAFSFVSIIMIELHMSFLLVYGSIQTFLGDVCTYVIRIVVPSISLAF